MKFKRIFLLVLESLGVGEASDASNYGDTGANTLGHIKEQCDLFVPNLKKIGFLNTINLDENTDVETYYTIAKPINAGKDSLNGYYEMMGIKNDVAFKTFNNGFPDQLITEIETITGRRVLGNTCCTDDCLMKELGERQINYGALIVYTSADSDLTIAAHEDVIPAATLYHYCEKVREITLRRDEWRVGRISARPFTGKNDNFRFINSARKDYAVKPPKRTVLDSLKDNNYNVIGIGNVNDVFDGQGINKVIKANNNIDALSKMNDIMDKNFTGLCIVSLSDFDSVHGHARDIEGYASAIEELDIEIPMILNKLELDDLLIITADNGNDPTFPGNDHTRENVPVIIYSRSFKEPKLLSPSDTLADIGSTIADNFDLIQPEIGHSILDKLI